MTILFSDIRSFTTLSEHMTPEENFAFLNSYLAMIGPIVRQNGGFIAKYIGDAIMALFPRFAADALATAVQMQRAESGLRRASAFMPERHSPRGRAPGVGGDADLAAAAVPGGACPL